MIDPSAVERGRIYAIVLDSEGSTGPFRPLRAQLSTDPAWLTIDDPLYPDHPIQRTLSGCTLLGEWDRDWRQNANHHLGQVLRQRDLVDRLAVFGIIREKEPYIIRDDSPNAVERSVVLNYDELDIILSAASVD